MGFLENNRFNIFYEKPFVIQMAFFVSYKEESDIIMVGVKHIIFPHFNKEY